MPASNEEFQRVRESSTLPILIGSGINDKNISSFKMATAVIVGSHFKRNGLWFNEIDEERLAHFMKIVRSIH